MDKEVNIDGLDVTLFPEEDVDKIVQLQRRLRHRFELKRLSSLTSHAARLKDQVVGADPSQEEIAIKANNQTTAIGNTSADVWIEIAAFAPGAVVGLSQTCQMLREISKMNFIWMPVLQHKFPLVFEKKQKLFDNGECPADVNWKSLLHEKYLMLSAFKQVLEVMSAKKAQGNDHFKQKDYDAASELYNAGIKFSGQSQNSLQRFGEVIGLQERLTYLHLSTILNANASQAELKREMPERALMNGVLAQKTLKVIKKIYQKERNERGFRAKYDQLLEKIGYRIDQALESLGPMARFVNYSPLPVDGLQQGTMLSHSSRAFAGFFDDTHVLMTEMTERSVKGIIVNKTHLLENGRRIFVGGPCELEHVTILHNIPNAPGARHVIEGIFEGGEVAQWKDDPNFKIVKFHGYSSWFPGQLQGEILNSSGWDFTNEVSVEDVLFPEEFFEFDDPEDINIRLPPEGAEESEEGEEGEERVEEEDSD